MNATLLVEGGSRDSKEVDSRCREGFRRLLERCGFAGRMPRIVACDHRENVFRTFRIEHDAQSTHGYVAMLIDSEVPVADTEKTWAHLEQHDGWTRPNGASDEQVLFMATCMETWIATDSEAVKRHFERPKPCVNEKALPAPNNAESRLPAQILDALVRATKSCSKSYEKGSESYRILATLAPDVLRSHLPSFDRCVSVLDAKL